LYNQIILSYFYKHVILNCRNTVVELPKFKFLSIICCNLFYWIIDLILNLWHELTFCKFKLSSCNEKTSTRYYSDNSRAPRSLRTKYLSQRTSRTERPPLPPQTGTLTRNHRPSIWLVAVDDWESSETVTV